MPPPLLWVSCRAGRGPCLFILQLSPLYNPPPPSFSWPLMVGGRNGKGQGCDTSFDLGCYLPFSFALFPFLHLICLASSSETLPRAMFLGPGEALGDLVKLPSRTSPGGAAGSNWKEHCCPLPLPTAACRARGWHQGAAGLSSSMGAAERWTCC